MTTGIRVSLAPLALVGIVAAGCQSGSETSGIDGTGVRGPVLVAAAAYGRLTASSGVNVNGVRYETDDAKVMVNGKVAALSDLAVGQVVSVAATVSDASATTGIAQSITGDFAVVGPVESVDDQNGSAVVLGQRIRVEDAKLDASLVESGGLVIGEPIEVSGFRNTRSEIVATWIGAAAAGARFLARGVVSGVQPDGSFHLNGLTVTSSPTSAVPPVAEGEVAEVRAEQAHVSGDEMIADEVLPKPTDVVANPGDYVSLEGYPTRLDASRPSSLEVAGLPIATTPDTVIDGAVGADMLTTIDGNLVTGGRLVASAVHVPFQVPTGLHVLDGTVFDRYLGPLAAMPVNAFVYLPNGNGYAEPVSTDAAGRFEVTGLPDSRVVLWVGGWDKGYFQPCGAAVDVHGDVTRDIEVVTASTLSSLDPPRPLTAREPAFTGTVFEQTAAGRQPVAGAIVEVDDAGLVTLATTQTDLQGRYFLCDLPQPTTEIDVYKDGYVTYTWPVASTQSATIDIEFKRTILVHP